MGYRTSSREAMTGTQGVTLETGMEVEAMEGRCLQLAQPAFLVHPELPLSMVGWILVLASIKKTPPPPHITTSQYNGSSFLIEVPSSQGTVVMAS